MKEIAEQLSIHYSSLSESTLASWEAKSTLIQVPPGKRLVRYGQYHHTLFFVVKGSLKAYYHKEDKQITDWFSFENEFITSSTSYFTNEPSLHCIESMEECILLETKQEDVEELCQYHHDFEHLFRIILSKVIVQFRARMVSIQFQTVKERYHNLLNHYPNIEQRAPLKDIASFLGITQETLSRIRAEKV